MEACQQFQKLTFNKILHCTFLNKSEDGKFYVSLSDPQTRLNIAHVLITSEYAKPVAKKSIQNSDIKSDAQKSVCNISDVKSPGRDLGPKLYCQPIALVG